MTNEGHSMKMYEESVKEVSDVISLWLMKQVLHRVADKKGSNEKVLLFQLNV